MPPGPSLPAEVSAQPARGTLSTLRFDVYCLNSTGQNAITIRSSDPHNDPYVLRLNGGPPGELALFYSDHGRTTRAGGSLTLPPTGTTHLTARSDGPSPVQITAVQATGGCHVQPSAPLPTVVFATQATPILFTEPDPLVLDRPAPTPPPPTPRS